MANKDKQYKKKTDKVTKIDSYTKEDVLNAIEGTGGVVSAIARKLNVARSTAQRLIDMWDETKQAFDDEEKAMNDLCKTTILYAIKNGDTPSAKWWLSKKNKAEGFGDEPMNVTVQNVATQSTEQIKQSLDRLSPEERDTYLELCEKINAEKEEQ